MTRVESVTGQSEYVIDRGWELVRLAPGAPLEEGSAKWHPAVVPGTVAMVLHGDHAELDRWDHVYRCRFGSPIDDGLRTLLCFDGLATLAEVTLNGRVILTSANMFQEHAVDISGVLASENELVIRFRALLPVLHERRPRGRFPTRLVSEKNLRF